MSLYDNSIKYHSFIGTLVSKELFGIRGDLFFSARIDYLINTGKIIVERIVREKNIIGEIVIKKYIMINKMWLWSCIFFLTIIILCSMI